jgi:N utilization substance protein B
MRQEAKEVLLKEFRDFHKKLNEDIQTFTESVFLGTVKEMGKIDRVISELAENWKLSRLSVIDKNILRLAIYEISFRDDIPENVSIDEAIELAKEYSGDDAGAFINGILDRVVNNKEAYREILFPASPPVG